MLSGTKHDSFVDAPAALQRGVDRARRLHGRARLREASGAGVCELIHVATGNQMFGALAYTGFFLNLFNMMPVGFLDGGRIVTALSPWMWLIGFAILLGMTIMHPNFLLILILIASLPRLFSLFRKKSDEERRYFEITPEQRWMMAVMYFGLIALLVLGMHTSHIPRESLDR